MLFLNEVHGGDVSRRSKFALLNGILCNPTLESPHLGEELAGSAAERCPSYSIKRGISTLPPNLMENENQRCQELEDCMNKYNSYNSEASSQISDHQVDQSHDPSWWEWCSDPRVEASILAISTLIALITWGLVDR